MSLTPVAAQRGEQSEAIGRITGTHVSFWQSSYLFESLAVDFQHDVHLHPPLSPFQLDNLELIKVS